MRFQDLEVWRRTSIISGEEERYACPECGAYGGWMQGELLLRHGRSCSHRGTTDIYDFQGVPYPWRATSNPSHTTEPDPTA